MKNKISDLRLQLFETLEKLQDDEIEVSRAKAIASVGQTIINSVKVELDFIKLKDRAKNKSEINTPELLKLPDAKD